MRAFIGPIFSPSIIARAAALLVVLWILGGASRAQAACGSYVMIGRPSVEAMAAFHQMGDEPLSRPCTGPQCRAQDRTPAAPMAIDQVSLTNEAACLADMRDSPDLTGQLMDLSDWTTDSESHLNPIDPPPRA